MFRVEGFGFRVVSVPALVLCLSCLACVSGATGGVSFTLVGDELCLGCLLIASRKTIHRMADIAIQLEPRIRRGRVAASKNAAERVDGPSGGSQASADITFFYWAETLDEETAEQRVSALVRPTAPALGGQGLSYGRKTSRMATLGLVVVQLLLLLLLLVLLLLPL